MENSPNIYTQPVSRVERIRRFAGAVLRVSPPVERRVSSQLDVGRTPSQAAGTQLVIAAIRLQQPEVGVGYTDKDCEISAIKEV